MQRHLGIDVGKTGLRVGLFDAGMVLVERWSCATADVRRALEELAGTLRAMRGTERIGSVGISIFGPLQVDRGSPEYGAVIESSEAAWSGVNVPGLVASVLGQEVWFDFDVNAGALAEAELGSGKGVSRFVYLSVGTGIGAAVFAGSLQPGFAPQIGHMYLPREADDAAFGGSCRFHGVCLQGLASGKAMAERWGKAAEALPADHPAWELEARYLARACANLVYMFSPEAILLGSSVGAAESLSLPEVNRYTLRLLNDFVDPDLRVRFRSAPVVSRAALGAQCSLTGAALLGARGAGLRFVHR